MSSALGNKHRQACKQRRPHRSSRQASDLLRSIRKTYWQRPGFEQLEQRLLLTCASPVDTNDRACIAWNELRDSQLFSHFLSTAVSHNNSVLDESLNNQVGIDDVPLVVELVLDEAADAFDGSTADEINFNISLAGEIQVGADLELGSLELEASAGRGYQFKRTFDDNPDKETWRVARQRIWEIGGSRGGDVRFRIRRGCRRLRSVSHSGH